MDERLTDPTEARLTLDDRVRVLRSMSYRRLRALADGPPPKWSLLGGRIQIDGSDRELEEFRARSGRLYQLETFAVLEEGRNVHVFVSLLEERKASRTLDADFIIAPDGSFVEE
jgi:hypothetical protein